jgi:type I restriction enzyme R subunit
MDRPTQELMKTDTSEKGLETLIMRHMTGTDGLATGTAGVLAEAESAKAGSGWVAGSPTAYDREFAVDSEQLFSFLIATQPEEWSKLDIGNYKDKQGMARQRFLARLQGEITRRGVIDVLRHGIKHGPLSFDLFYGKPSAENAKAVERHAKNRFSITRQLHFSRENKRSLDLCAFINGLPVITFELKNSLTKQTVEDAIEQYKRDRDPRETLFEFGRCVVAGPICVFHDPIDGVALLL